MRRHRPAIVTVAVVTAGIAVLFASRWVSQLRPRPEKADIAQPTASAAAPPVIRTNRESAKTDDEVRLVNDSLESHVSITGSVSDAGLDALRGNQRIQSILMHHCPAGTEDGLNVLPTLSGLSRFMARGTGLTDGGLVEIGKCERLRTLSLSGCQHITDAGLLKLEHAESLSDLTLDANPQITGAGMAAAVERMPGLTSLVIRGFPLSAQEAAVVIRLPGLKRLEVDMWDTSEGVNRLRVWWRNSPNKKDWKGF